MKKINITNPVKSLTCIKCYSLDIPKSIKALAILSDTIVKISAIEQEDLQSYLQLEKAPSLEVIKLEIQLKQ